MQEISIAKDFIEDILFHARRHGLDTHQLLQRSGIPLSILQQPQVRFTPEQYATLQKLTMRAMNDEMLGYCQKASKVGTWSAACHWMILCRNLSQALKRFSHFYSLTESAFQVDLHSRDEDFVVELSPWQCSENIMPYGYIYFMFALHRVMCWLAEENLPIKQVRLPFKIPTSLTEYRAIFPGARLLFNQDKAALVFHRNTRELPIKQTPETLVEFLKMPLLNIIINDYSQQTWTGRTRTLLQEQLTNTPTLSDIANQLEVHPKKLRRELEAEGISYGELKSQLRRDIAIRLLSRSQDSVEHIAFQIGFAETSTFTRAFKRWTGVTPFNYRKLAKASKRTT